MRKSPSPVTQLFWSLSLGLLASPIALAVSPQEDAQPEQEEDRRTRRTERVLKLHDGRFVRGHCKLEGQHWLLERGKQTLRLPESAVVESAEVSPLLRELGKKRKAVRPTDQQARLELLQWTVDQGLYEESLTTFDRVLLLSPDEPIALDLLSQVPYTVPIPIQGPYETIDRDGLNRLLHFAGSNLPTVQEKVVTILRDYEDQELLREVLGKFLYTGLERPRAYATLVWRRLYPGEQQRALLGRAVLDRSKKVRAGASFALAKVEEPAMVIPVVRALSSEHKLVRMYAAEALGNMGYKEAVEPLMHALSGLSSAQSGSSGVPPAANINITEQVAYVSDFDVEIAQGASIADPQINVIGSGAMFTARSLGISGYSIVQHRKTIIRSLEKLTGEEHGKRANAWLDWWDAKKAAQAEDAK